MAEPFTPREFVELTADGVAEVIREHSSYHTDPDTEPYAEYPIECECGRHFADTHCWAKHVVDIMFPEKT